jgi:methyltransferase (TIGR00027 family)
MAKAQQSGTAAAAAAGRAAHYLHDHPRVFDDPFAIQLTSPVWRTICRSRLLHWLVFRKVLGVLRPAFAQALVRSRYTEDQLEAAIAGGCAQYVIVGAGLDSFALRRRDLAPKLRVYELDQPGGQQAKREQLARLRLETPPNLEFIPVDFEQETVAAALARSSYAPGQPAFFSWLGNVGYLTREAIFGTLRSIVSYATPGSGLIFDYAIPDELVDLAELPAIVAVRRFAARRGEPIITSFDPRTLPDEMRDLGFDLVENLSPAEQKARYFANRADGLYPLASTYFVHLRVRG